MRTPSPVSRTGPPLVVLVGLTAVGKTALAVRLAESLGGEIVSADSRQVYRRMDIGTAKPTALEQARARHHLLDIVDPGQRLSAAEFQASAYAAIDDTLARGQIPFLVGGTGQYVWAVVEGWQVPRVAPNEALRQALYEQAAREGPGALHERLEALDATAARRIDPRNVRRVVRALEVCLTTGRAISAQQTKAPPPYRVLVLGLTLARTELYRRIDERIDRMVSQGLEEEVRRLVGAGYGFDLPAMSGVGYGQFQAYLAGEMTRADAVREIKRATRRLARQQSNWFRLDDPRIRWFETQADPFPDILALVREFASPRGNTKSRPQACARVPR
jgi:tRNA dimethylallyltransferase